MIILLYLYPLMGIVHVIAALLRFCFGEKRYPEYKNRLATYLLVVGVYFFIMILFCNIDVLYDMTSNNIGTIYIGIIPWFIAAYYWSIIYAKPEESIFTDTNSIIKNH